MSRRKILPVSLFILAAFLIAATPAFAQDTTRSTSSRSAAASSRSSAIASRSASREERVAERCTRVGQRIDLIIDRYNANKDRHVARYEAIAERVTNLLDRIAEAGYDTTLVRDIVTRIVNEKQSFVTNYTSFIAGMEEAKQHACGASEGEFVDAIARARTELLEARQDSIDARTLVNNELRSALQDLRSEINASN